MAKTKTINERIISTIKYYLFWMRLEDYLVDSPVKVVEDFRELEEKKPNFSEEEKDLVEMVAQDSVKLAGYILNAKGLIWEAIAHLGKLYTFQSLLWNVHKGDEFDFHKEQIEFYKQQIGTYPPLLTTCPSEETNLVHRYVSYIGNILTKYHTYKKMILTFLKHYSAEDILKLELFELWESQYEHSLTRTHIVIWDNKEFLIGVPALDEVAQISHSLYQDLDECLNTDLGIEHIKEIKFSYVNVFSQGFIEDMKAQGITLEDLEVEL